MDREGEESAYGKRVCQIRRNGASPAIISRPATATCSAPVWSRPAPPLTVAADRGRLSCRLLFHINQGAYGDVKLDGLNLVVCASSDGPMGNGNWTGATYVDERADDRQTEALGAIFSGAAGGPMAAFAPLFGKSLGVKKAPITFKIDGKVRSGAIPGVLSMSVRAVADASPKAERSGLRRRIRSTRRKLALATGRPGQHLCRLRAQVGQFRTKRPLRRDQLVELAETPVFALPAP